MVPGLDNNESALSHISLSISTDTEDTPKLSSVIDNFVLSDCTVVSWISDLLGSMTVLFLHVLTKDEDQNSCNESHRSSVDMAFQMCLSFLRY